MAQVFFYPAPTISISAVGVNGATAPTTSIEVGGINPSGNLQPLQTDASGNLRVSIDSEPGAPFHVIVDSSALPTGAATSAAQTDGSQKSQIVDSTGAVWGPRTGVASVNYMPVINLEAATPGGATVARSLQVGGSDGTNLRTLSVDTTGKLNVLGPLTDAELRASAVPVSVASLPLPAGAATAALQTSGNASLSSIDGKIAPDFGTSPQAIRVAALLGSSNGPADFGSGNVNPTTTLRVAIANNPPLPTGAATAANQATEIASLASIDTKLTSPLAVTGPLTDAQLRATPVPVSGTVSTGGLTDTQLRASPVPVSGTVAVTGVATAANQTTGNASLASIDTKTPALGQALAAASTPVVLTAAQLSTLTPLSTVAATQSGTWNITNITGTISLPTGASTEAKQDAAIAYLASIDGKTQNGFGPAIGAIRMLAMPSNASGLADFGAGAAGAQTPRVVIATGGAAPSAASGRSLANAPTRNDYTSTSVTTAAFVQLIASTTSAANLVEVFDSSGQTLALAVGAAASEVIQFYIFPGGNGQVPLAIPAGSRVSVKAISATASVGELDINLYT